MRIRLIAVGQRPPRWLDEGYREFAQRLPPECRLDLTEIPAAERGKNADIARAKRAEGERMLKALRPDDHVIALDEHGDQWSSTALARELQRWLQDGRDVCLLVGGPDGLDEACLARAQRRWSLSRLTLPHALVRLVVAEQIYRAWSITRGHPYHRA